MGYSNELAIAEANRNEAQEAIEIINRLNFQNAFNKIKAIEGEFELKNISGETLEAIEAVNAMRHELKRAVKHINSFIEKHQPETDHWK